MGMKRRLAIITGGGRGIGKAIAKRFLEGGIAVVIAELDREAGCETERDLSRFGEISFVHADAADEKMVVDVVRRAIAHHGRLDILVNNAGIMIRKPVWELSLEEWNRVLAVNLAGPFLYSKHSAGALRASHGSIINIASTRALMSEPNTESYSASKGGIVALTHALAISLGPQVRVNCISPGWIDVTGMADKSAQREAKLRAEDHEQHPAGRVGKPEDIADLAMFLALDGAGFITGANFTVDGGMTRKMIYN